MLNLFANLQTPIFWLQIEFPFIKRSRTQSILYLKKIRIQVKIYTEKENTTKTCSRAFRNIHACGLLPSYKRFSHAYLWQKFMRKQLIQLLQSMTRPIRLYVYAIEAFNVLFFFIGTISNEMNVITCFSCKQAHHWQIIKRERKNGRRKIILLESISSESSDLCI